MLYSLLESRKFGTTFFKHTSVSAKNIYFPAKKFGPPIGHRYDSRLRQRGGGVKFYPLIWVNQSKACAAGITHCDSVWYPVVTRVHILRGRGVKQRRKEYLNFPPKNRTSHMVTECVSDFWMSKKLSYRKETAAYRQRHNALEPLRPRKKTRKITPFNRKRCVFDTRATKDTDNKP